MRAFNVLSSLVVGVLLLPVLAVGQAPARDTTFSLPAYRLRIMGVYDQRSGLAVEGADISDVMSGITARTTTTGTVALAFLPEGGGLVRIRKVGYEPATLMVSISEQDTIPLTVLLNKVVELPAVSIMDSAPRYTSPALRGFEERRRNAPSGQFLPEALIRKEETRDLGEFLHAHLVNALIANGRTGEFFILQSPHCGVGGPPAVYLDGALVTGDRPGVPANLNNFTMLELAGIEYYPNTATAPPQFNGTATSCGALLLWTREK